MTCLAWSLALTMSLLTLSGRGEELGHESGGQTNVWVGISSAHRVLSAQSACALVSSQFNCSHMVAPQPTVSEAQLIRSAKQRQGLQMAEGLEREQ